MKPLKLVAALTLASMPVFTLAESYPAPIENLREKGVEVLETFDAPSGLQGYAAIYHGNPLALYLTSDKAHVLIGSLVDAQGEDLTRPVIDEKVNRPQSEILWNKLEQDSHWVAEGSADAVTTVYVFTDPNCPYCKRLWNDVQPWIKSGKVQIRHIPVGVLGESSRKKSAYILAAENSLQALIDNESEKKLAKENPVSETQSKQLDENLMLMQQLGASGTPAILYRDSSGLLQLHPGAAQSDQLTEIFGTTP